MVSLKDTHGSHEYSFYSTTSLTKANISLPSLKNSVLFNAGTSLSSSQTALSFCIAVSTFSGFFCYQSHPESEHQQILLSKQELILLQCQGVAAGNRLQSLTSSSSQLIAIQVRFFSVRSVCENSFYPFNTLQLKIRIFINDFQEILGKLLTILRIIIRFLCRFHCQ